MFKVRFTQQIVNVRPTGQSFPVGSEVDSYFETVFVEREAAVKSCDEHFSTLKSNLQKKVPNNPLISLSELCWEGNCGTPAVPLGIRSFDNPPAQVYEVLYRILPVA